MFQAAYESAWQHPGIAWLAGAPLLLFGLWALMQGRRQRDQDPRRRAWVWLFLCLQLEILLDAWFTGALSPVVSSGAAGTTAVVLAIVLGDLRYFYLVERQLGPVMSGPRASLRALLVALPLSLLVPVAIQLLRLVDPVRCSGHLMFLAYELGLLGLVIGYTFSRLRSLTDRADGRARYLRRLLAIEVAQYALWALADVLILRGVDLGYLLRIVPNAIYYAAFVPVATLATPPGARA